MLVYTDNGIADPWLVSQLVIQHTQRLVPLVAVQPAYMTPLCAAKMVASLGWMHGRAVALNMVAGGFRNDLLALGDPTPHDERYERLIEYVAIIKSLLADQAPVTHEGKHYRVRNLRMALSFRSRANSGHSGIRLITGRRSRRGDDGRHQRHLSRAHWRGYPAGAE